MNKQTLNIKPGIAKYDERMSLKNATLIASFSFLMMGCLVILTAAFWMISSQHVILTSLLALAGAGMCWLSGAYYGGFKKR